MGGGVSKETSLNFVLSDYFAINLHSGTLTVPTNKRTDFRLPNACTCSCSIKFIY